MEYVKESGIFKVMIMFVSFLMVFSTLSSPLASANSVNDYTYDEIEEKGELILSLIEKEDGKEYVSSDYVANGFITHLEHENINNFLEDINKQGIYLSDSKNHDLIQPMALPAIPFAVKVFLAGLGALVGENLAENIADDFYNWGATSACNSWSHIGVVNSFCSANGYL